jgi:3'-phosphoadenosine 5'-phosphosulfate sulfotransferase (PAPS reductase)/FAD synthetase
MSGDVLFDDAELFTGDPLNPDCEQVCPPTVIATLTRPQREQRVENLITQAHLIVDKAWEIHSGGRMRAAWCVLYSGGNDSTVLAHMMRNRVDYAVHANTSIGIEETRQFVRDTCTTWGLELIERHAPVTYRELVLERGFPGPAMHYKMYQRLKERVLDQVRSELISHPRRQRVMFIAGRRRAESQRRTVIPLYEADGSAIWASPLAMWTKLDLNTYRLMTGDVPINSVSEKLHMSGECLCGAFAKPGELDEIRFWYPDVAAQIDQLQRDVEAAGHKPPLCTWGHGGRGGAQPVGKLCTSCNIDQFGLWDVGT